MNSKFASSILKNFHIVGLLLTLKFLFSTQNHGLFSYLALVISISIIYVLYKISVHYRENEGAGTIKYSTAFFYTFFIYLFGSFVSSIVMFIYTQFINKEFLDITLNLILQTYEKFNIPINAETNKTLETLFKPVSYSFLNIFSSLFVGTFWGLIIAAFVKKEKDIFEQ
jgi:hypothetical protein